MPPGAKKRKAAKRRKAEKARIKSSASTLVSDDHKSKKENADSNLKDSDFASGRPEEENAKAEALTVDSLPNECEGHSKVINGFFEVHSEVFSEETYCNERLNVEPVDTLPGSSDDENQNEKAYNFHQEAVLSDDMTSKPIPAYNGTNSNEISQSKGSLMNDNSRSSSSDNEEGNGDSLRADESTGESVFPISQKDEITQNCHAFTLDAATNMRNFLSCEKDTEKDHKYFSLCSHSGDTVVFKMTSSEGDNVETEKDHEDFRLSVFKMTSAEVVKENNVMPISSYPSIEASPPIKCSQHNVNQSDQATPVLEPQVAEITSWRSCCGLFDLLMGRNR